MESPTPALRWTGNVRIAQPLHPIAQRPGERGPPAACPHHLRSHRASRPLPIPQAQRPSFSSQHRRERAGVPPRASGRPPQLRVLSTSHWSAKTFPLRTRPALSRPWDRRYLPNRGVRPTIGSRHTGCFGRKGGRPPTSSKELRSTRGISLNSTIRRGRKSGKHARFQKQMSQRRLTLNDTAVAQQYH